MPISQIVTNSIANDAVVTADIANAAVTPAKLSQPLTRGTAVSASGTSIDFTGIPSWVIRITIMFNGISTNGSSNVLVQLGDSGGIENTDYISGGSIVAGGVASGTSTAGFLCGVDGGGGAAPLVSGNAIITNISGNIWCFSSITGANSPNTFTRIGGGSKTLSATLDRIRITTVNGTDVFDAGTINILYE